MREVDLIESAIADAKAVRESAIETAKLALTERYLPKLEEWLDSEFSDEPLRETKTPAAAGKKGSVTEEEDEDDEDAKNESSEEDEDDEDAKNESSEEDEEEDDTVSESLDLAAIMEELDAAIEDEEDESMYEEGYDGDDDDDESMDEGAIGLGDLFTERELASLLSGLNEGDESPRRRQRNVPRRSKMPSTSTNKLKTDLAEAYSVIRQMRDTINEVNLLNSKLLYTNKLFSAFNLSESAMKTVLAAFDRATTLREVKLVYTSIGAQLNEGRRPAPVRKEHRTRRFASDAAGMISEGKNGNTTTDAGVNRLQQLAGLRKAY